MTVVEIAKQAGVSIGTVDRVLHNRGRVSPETRKRIQEIIDRESYQPNPLARHLKRNKEYRIGVLIPELEKESGYWRLIHNGILKACDELSAFSFRIEVFPFIRPNRTSLVAAYEKMAASDCCASIIAPVMQEETMVLLLGDEKKKPYCFIDSSLPGASPITAVTQDPFRGGFLAGRLMDLVSHSDGPYAVVRPYTEAFNLNERARGFHAWFAARAGVRLIDVVCPDIHMDELNKILARTLDENPDIRGFFAVSSIGHRIANFVSERALKGQVSIIGYDMVAENERCLKDGSIDCLISQRPEEQGRQVLHQLYRKIVLEEEAEEKIEMPFDIFFKENLL